MKLVVVSYKNCWPHAGSPTGYATDGGFPFQMRALSELFDSTTLLLPCLSAAPHNNQEFLGGHQLTVKPIAPLKGTDLARKLRFPGWLLRNCFTIWREVSAADAIHTPIPGDIGTIGMLLAFLLRKPLFIRHCGNWLRPETVAEHFWKNFMVRWGGGRTVCLATGGGTEPPAPENPAVQWIFSTALTQRELQQCATQPRELKHSARLVMAARQTVEKGAGRVIKALPALLPDFPGLQFDVIGDGHDLASFKELAERLGVSQHVVFHGAVNHDRVIELMQAADIFCFPTTASEGFPKAVLEGLACGLPVITTHVSVLPALIGEGGGLLIESVSAEAIATAVRQCLSNPVRYRAMSEQAVKTAQRYSLESWRDTIGEHLTKAWGQKLRNA
jgi:hypothetical protein